MQNEVKGTNRIRYLEALLKWSGCWVFIERPCGLDYIGFLLVIVVVTVDIMCDYMMYWHEAVHEGDRDHGPGEGPKNIARCDLDSLFIVFGILRHIETFCRLSFFAFKFKFIWKDPWIAHNILSFEVIKDEEDARQRVPSLFASLSIAQVPRNYDYLGQTKHNREQILRARSRSNGIRKHTMEALESNNYKYPFKSQKMYKRIKGHCIIGCLLITAITVYYRFNVVSIIIDAVHGFDDGLSQAQHTMMEHGLLGAQILLTVGSVWTNLSMIIFFDVVYINNFIAIRYIKFYFRTIVETSFTRLTDDDSIKKKKSNILQAYDDMYYFIQDNNESFQLWVALLIFYVGLNWWMFFSLLTQCSAYSVKLVTLSSIAYCLLYTVNLVILVWSGLRVSKEFDALKTNVADMTEEIQFGYSRFSQFTQYAQMIRTEAVENVAPVHSHPVRKKKKLKNPLAKVGNVELASLKSPTLRPLNDDTIVLVPDDIEHSPKSPNNKGRQKYLLRDYNKLPDKQLVMKVRSSTRELVNDMELSLANSPRDSPIDDDLEVSYEEVRPVSIMRKFDEKNQSVSVRHITRLMQLSRALDARPATFTLFGISFTESRIYGSLAAFVMSRILAMAVMFSFGVDN